MVTAVEPLPNGGAIVRVRSEGMAHERPEPKDSIALDGVCLTATSIEGDEVEFDVIPETLARSTLGQRVPGDTVNLEYALRVGDRLGGHFVYGHVDAAARVTSRAREGQGERVRIERPQSLAFALVEKAFVAIDGVSVTIARAGDDWFEVALIRETLTRTTLGARPAGSRVNLEIDPLARYANRQP
ncbi:MAG: riboflavin synthase [Candidatus Eremiobacteraeota bacterium]|nr:riboflavin synthase [Candidatus Eremiobacteraeota bacterium]